MSKNCPPRTEIHKIFLSFEKFTENIQFVTKWWFLLNMLDKSKKKKLWFQQTGFEKQILFEQNYNISKVCFGMIILTFQFMDAITINLRGIFFSMRTYYPWYMRNKKNAHKPMHNNIEIFSAIDIIISTYHSQSAIMSCSLLHGSMMVFRNSWTQSLASLHVPRFQYWRSLGYNYTSFAESASPWWQKQFSTQKVEKIACILQQWKK